MSGWQYIESVFTACSFFSLLLGVGTFHYPIKFCNGDGMGTIAGAILVFYYLCLCNLLSSRKKYEKRLHLLWSKWCNWKGEFAGRDALLPSHVSFGKSLNNFGSKIFHFFNKKLFRTTHLFQPYFLTAFNVIFVHPPLKWKKTWNNKS